MEADRKDSDDVPSKFYKYHSLNGNSALHLISTLLNKEVHFSSPRSFNDPFDCKPRYAGNLSQENFITHFVRVASARTAYLSPEFLAGQGEKAWINSASQHGNIQSMILNIQKEMGRNLEHSAIYCVSSRNDDILMWGHYADSHRGICLEFDSGSDFLKSAMRVDYEDTRPEVEIFDRDNTVEKMRKSLLVKSSHWKYEKEWRVVELTKQAGLRKFNDGDLTGIIFGSAISPSMQNTIAGIAKNHPTPIKFYNAIPDEFEFKLRIEQLHEN